MIATPNDTTAAPSSDDPPEMDARRVTGLLREYVPKLDAATETYQARRKRTLPRIAIDRERLADWKYVGRRIGITLAALVGLQVLINLVNVGTIFDGYIFLGLLVWGVAGTVVTVRGPASARHVQAAEYRIRTLSTTLRRVVDYADALAENTDLHRTDDLELNLRIADANGALHHADIILDGTS